MKISHISQMRGECRFSKPPKLEGEARSLELHVCDVCDLVLESNDVFAVEEGVSSMKYDTR